MSKDKPNQTNNVFKPSRSLRPGRFCSAGFTLIELIIVIVITGIIGGIVGIFLKTPMTQYMDIARRAEITDIADTALRRMGRDIRTAVPNSVRLPTPTGSTYIEFLPTKANVASEMSGGGRYRSNNTGNAGGCGATGNELDFAIADSCFEITGSQINFAANDYIVVGSTQADGNLPYNQTTSGVLRAYTGAAGAQSAVNITATQFPASASLSSQRFEVISGTEKAVTYACENVSTVSGNGTGTLKRYSAYGFNATQAAPPFGTGFNALLADKISACSMAYDTTNQRNGLVAISLTITRDNESISLYHEIHVNNMP